jgi:hypothetical protein
MKNSERTEPLWKRSTGWFRVQLKTPQEGGLIVTPTR